MAGARARSNTSGRRPGDRAEHGGTMLIAMISMTGLLALALVTVLTLGGGTSAAANQRFKTLALYAAESGVSAGIVYLRQQYVSGAYWTSLVSPSNDAPQSPDDIPGNGIAAADEDSLFGDDLSSSYTVTILNNPSDPQFEAGVDGDGRVILRSTGRGPNGAVAIVEVEVAPNGSGLGGSGGAVSRPCPGYGQRGMTGDNAGRNDCLSNVDSTNVTTYRPGS